MVEDVFSDVSLDSCLPLNCAKHLRWYDDNFVGTELNKGSEIKEASVGI